MAQDSATQRRTITMEAYRDKVLILSEGSISVSVADGSVPMPARPPHFRWWPAITTIAIALAMLSTGFALYTVHRMQDALSAEIEEQSRQFQARLDAAFNEARSRSDHQVETLLLKADDLDEKLELVPERIDTAAQTISASVADSVAAFKHALGGKDPARTSPILVIKRRKPL